MYKRQVLANVAGLGQRGGIGYGERHVQQSSEGFGQQGLACLLYTSDAADERSSVDLGGRRIIKKKNNSTSGGSGASTQK